MLILLFWFSQNQGYQDARRDAIETTSTLPVVSLVLPQPDGVLAQDLRQLNDSGESIPDPTPPLPGKMTPLHPDHFHPQGS